MLCLSAAAHRRSLRCVRTRAQTEKKLTQQIRAVGVMSNARGYVVAGIESRVVVRQPGVDKCVAPRGTGVRRC